MYLKCILGTQHSDYKKQIIHKLFKVCLKTSIADLILNYIKVGYLLLISTEVQYCNVFWDTYTQTIKVTIAQS